MKQTKIRMVSSYQSLNFKLSYVANRNQVNLEQTRTFTATIIPMTQKTNTDSNPLTKKKLIINKIETIAMATRMNKIEMDSNRKKKWSTLSERLRGD